MPEHGRRIHLDLVGGLAGDMFAAALLDALPTLREPLLSLLSRPEIAVPVEVRVEACRGASLLGSRFVVRLPPVPRHAHRHDDDHLPADARSSRSDRHRHGHVAHAAIVARLEAAPLAAPVLEHALAIFRQLAEAEAAVHGTPVDAVEFHEVGAWDSIVDIVAAAFLIDAAGPARWSHGAVPLGGGVVHTAHGLMPVPAPATLRLLMGSLVVDDGVSGERVTPTGAAILRHLDERFPAAMPARVPERVVASGLGFGTRVLKDRPNAVRCTVFESVPHPAGDAVTLPEDWVDTLEFDVDDQSPEDLAVGLDALRSRADIRQVTQVAVVGKKGRLAARVHVVASAGAAAGVAAACFQETTTIGLRWQRVPRFVLERRAVRVEATGGAALNVKLSERGDTRTAKAEMDELAALAGGHAVRDAARREAESRALVQASNDDATQDRVASDGAPSDER